MKGQSLPPFLIHQGLKNIKALFTSLFLELAEMEIWPALYDSGPLCTALLTTTHKTHPKKLKKTRTYILLAVVCPTRPILKVHTTEMIMWLPEFHIQEQEALFR
jgi:hypothetical protein